MITGRKVSDIGPEESEQMKRERTEKGMQYKQIAWLHGLTDHQLSLWRVRENFEVPPAYKDGNPKKKSGAQRKLDRDGIINDYNAGMSTRGIAEKYGTTINSVSNIMQGNKCLNRQIYDADWGKVGALHRAGWSNEDIAVDMWIDTEAVEIILKRMKKRERRKEIQHVAEA